MAAITFEDVTKRFDDGTKAVDALNLDIRDGELMVLVGPSGCGKTTALRMVAGLEEASSGVIRIGNRVVNELPPRERDVAMVFQNYALYPHLTVFENIAFGLKLRKAPKTEIETRVREVARVLGLEELLRRKPRALSGGQRQRVAMGRAIVRQPDAFLMDEPLSNLDAKLRVDMRTEIIRLQRVLNATTVYVTHDQVEAMTMGDRVGVLRDGLLQQVDDPQTLYDRPVNLFVGSFIGSPAMNALQGTIETQPSGATTVRLGQQTLLLDDECLRIRPALARYTGRDIVVGIRPEHFRTDAASAKATTSIKGVVELAEALGSDVLVYLAVDGNQSSTLASPSNARVLSELRHQREIIVARLDADAQVSEGESMELFVPSRRLHFFDAATGGAIYE